MKSKFKTRTLFITLLGATLVICYNIAIHFYLNFFRSPVRKVTLKDPNLKYILQWTSAKTVPFVDMGKGRQGFIDRKCPYTNCYVTNNRKLLGDLTNFEVIAFHGPEVIRWPITWLPKKRNLKQKYVFASIESAFTYPACTNRFDGFFNWTWTYKLDSKIQWGYIVIRDINGTKIGPSPNMHWLRQEDMAPVPNYIKNQLKSKSKAAVWVVSNCSPNNDRKLIAEELKYELSLYNLTLDTYGKCGQKCPEDDCWKAVKDDYYFYLSFENANAVDYVTEKLLNALNNNAVPVVYGGANYTRFMPDGMYLNARELNVTKLAAKINELVHDPVQYYEYFKWRSHYHYQATTQSVDTNEYCKMCALLNDEKQMKRTTIYKVFREYWDPPRACDIYTLR